MPEDGEGLGGRHVALDHEEGGHDGRRARVAEQAVHKHLQRGVGKSVSPQACEKPVDFKSGCMSTVSCLCSVHPLRQTEARNEVNRQVTLPIPLNYVPGCELLNVYKESSRS